MRWSIRNQILVPLIGIQAVAVTAATLTTATLAAGRSEREIIGRLNDVLDTLEHGSFPYTGSVLAKMRGLSGAHFIAWGEEGHVKETSLPTLEGLPLSLRTVPAAVHMDSLAELPTILVGGTRYFAVSIRSPSAPRGGSLVVLYPETSWRQARREAAMPALLLGVGSLGAMVLATSWIAHRMSSRIRRVQQQVAGIAAGDFRELDPGNGHDEVADLTVSINGMCSQLKEMRQTIQQSERARLLAQLAAGLAHQLRNSLTGARMSVQLHARRHPAPAGDETLSVALRQLAFIEEQVKGLLSAGRVERGPPETCDVHQLLADVALLVDPACQHARVALSRLQRDGAAALELCADRSSLRAAILNLTLNAIEAAGPGGTVSLEAYSRKGEVSIEVVDSGRGPPLDLADVLYEPFVTSKPEGVGLGLALARQVALDHDGRLLCTGRRGDRFHTHRSAGRPETRGARMSRILIVDDEASICWAFRESLGDLGHHVEVAATAEDGLRIAGSNLFDAVVLDVRLPGMDGLTAMRSFRERIGHAPMIIITAFGNLETAVRALEGGAFDYLVKPFDLDEATTVVKRALEKRRSREPAPSRAPCDTDELLIGSSPAMQELFKSIALVAPTDVPVLITGESGTGKELVARAIHRHSGRRDGPFLPICLAALNPGLVERELFGHVKGSFTGAVQDRAGLLELASGGTVLLDEIGDVSPSLQVKLLRAIEHREVTPVGDARPRFTDIRVVAATNRPLGELMAAGGFREDLFFRLSVFQIRLASLRERRDDIPALAEHFLRQARLADVSATPLAGDVVDELRTRAWAGNVRELRNAIEHAAIVARGQPIRPEHLPTAAAKPDLATPSPAAEIQGLLAAWAERAFRDQPDPTDATLYEQFLQLAEPPLLRALLEKCGQNRAAAAQILGIHRATLRQKLRKYGID